MTRFSPITPAAPVLAPAPVARPCPIPQAQRAEIQRAAAHLAKALADAADHALAVEHDDGSVTWPCRDQASEQANAIFDLMAPEIRAEVAAFTATRP